MANRIRCGVFHGVVGLGLLFATPLFAQAAPPKVVDANGNFVGWPRTSVFSPTVPIPGGPEITVNGVERHVNGVWLVIQANRGGFAVANTAFSFLFTSSDCSGNKYLDASKLPPSSWVVTNPPSNTELTLLFPGT